MANIKVTLTTDDGEVLEMFVVESKQADVNTAAYEVRDYVERQFETSGELDNSKGMGNCDS